MSEGEYPEVFEIDGNRFAIKVALLFMLILSLTGYMIYYIGRSIANAII